MTKRDYTSYPENYFNIIEKFKREGNDVVVYGTYGALSYARHDMHRFYVALRTAAATGDRHAAKLANITRDMVLIIEPPYAGRGDKAKLIVKVNPMTKAILESNPG